MAVNQARVDVFTLHIDLHSITVNIVNNLSPCCINRRYKAIGKFYGGIFDDFSGGRVD